MKVENDIKLRGAKRLTRERLKVLVLLAFPRLRGFWKNVRPVIPRMRSFFFF